MLKRLTIKARLIALLGITTLGMVILGIEGYVRGTQTAAALNDVYVRRLVPSIHLRNLKDAYAQTAIDAGNKYSYGGFTGPQAIASVNDALRRADDAWRQYTGSVEDDERRAASGVAVLKQRADNLLVDLRTKIQNNDRASTPQFVVGTVYPAVDALSNALDERSAALAARAREENDQSMSDNARAQRISLATFGVGLGLSVLIGLTIIGAITRSLNRVLREIRAGEGDLTRRITVDTHDEVSRVASTFNQLMDTLLALVKRIHQAGIQVTSSSTQLAASAKELEATMAEQMASTNEVVASAKQISSTGQALVGTMREVTTLVERTGTSAAAGRSNLARMGTTMHQIESASQGVSDKLAAINAKATTITTVVTTITKVADQTNLLSLNAAIEAAKAGEFGQGFAVVAREIRRLADRTAGATVDIEHMVHEMQSAVASGVMEMERFTQDVRSAVEAVAAVGGQLEHIIEQVQALTPRFEAVNEGMESQSVGARQISEAMMQLGEATRHTSEGLRDSRQAINLLNDAARGLQQHVARFKVTHDHDASPAASIDIPAGAARG